MCGVFATLGEGPFDLSRVDAACDAMAHRGPDGFGVTTLRNGTVALGHRRLALVGGAGGVQPIFGCEHSGYSAVVNGEFYGYSELRTALVKRGHRFVTRSDSELLVHLWEEHGAGAIALLRGEYAFALFDGEHLHLARDPSGVKPLHYAFDRDGRVWAASEIKALLAAGIPRRWNAHGLEQLFSMQFLDPAETLVAGVRAVAPGEQLVVGPRGIHVHVPPKVSAPDPVPVPIAELEGRVRDAFVDAVAVRLPEDGNIAFAVSGGFDSSAVVGAAAALGVAAPKGFAVAFSGEAWDERALAQAAISHAKGELTLIEPTPEDFLDHLDRAVWCAEGAASNGQLVAKYMLSRAVREAGFKAILTGEGADEAFLGYAHLLADAGHEPSAAPAQRGLMLPDGDGATLDLPETEALFAARGAAVPTFLRAKSALGAQFARLASPLFTQRRQADRCIAHVCRSLLEGREFAGDHVRQSSFLWRKLALAGYILRTLGDGTELAHSVEGRPPFLDEPLLRLAAGIPTATLLGDLHGNVGDKALLRRALGDFVPTVVAARKKHPFLAPPLPRTPEVIARVRARTAPSRLPHFIDPAAVAAFVETWATTGAPVDVGPPSLATPLPANSLAFANGRAPVELGPPSLATPLPGAVARDGVLHLLLTTTALGEQLALEG